MSVTLAVHVTPRAGRDEVAGWHGDELGVRVTVPPEDGKANAAVCAVVAKALRVAKGRVTVLRGATSRHKLLELDGVTAEELRAAFGEPG
jgi:uncharacterized protein (TIGR00251 family)